MFLHCGQGMERSPMTIAWVLWRAGEAKSFDAAPSPRPRPRNTGRGRRASAQAHLRLGGGPEMPLGASPAHQCAYLVSTMWRTVTAPLAT